MTTDKDFHTVGIRQSAQEIVIDGETKKVDDIVWPTDWVGDIHCMHKKYGFHKAMRDMDEETRRKYLEFRADFLQEELDELRANINNPEEVVDALIDLIVVATGTLDLFDINAQRAWQEVHRANMSKAVGMKETRQNDFGAPDLVKPEGWVAPSHHGNHGRLPR